MKNTDNLNGKSAVEISDVKGNEAKQRGSRPKRNKPVKKTGESVNMTRVNYEEDGNAVDDKFDNASKCENDPLNQVTDKELLEMYRKRYIHDRMNSAGMAADVLRLVIVFMAGCVGYFVGMVATAVESIVNDSIAHGSFVILERKPTTGEVVAGVVVALFMMWVSNKVCKYVLENELKKARKVATNDSDADAETVKWFRDKRRNDYIRDLERDKKRRESRDAVAAYREREKRRAERLYKKRVEEAGGALDENGDPIPVEKAQ